MGLKESGAVEGLTMDRNERDEFRLGMDKLCTQGIRPTLISHHNLSLKFIQVVPSVETVKMPDRYVIG